MTSSSSSSHPYERPSQLPHFERLPSSDDSSLLQPERSSPTPIAVDADTASEEEDEHDDEEDAGDHVRPDIEEADVAEREELPVLPDDAQPAAVSSSLNVVTSPSSSLSSYPPLPSPNSLPVSVPYLLRHSLYVSYAFAAFGDRMWEFASLILIMRLFPSTLLFSSVFGLLETAAAIVAGPFIGGYIDSRDRLSPLQLSIVGQNGSIGVGCVLLLIMLQQSSSALLLYGGWLLVTATAMTAKVSSSISKISLYKRWLPVLAAGSTDFLTQLNSSMRAIDLTASIVAPLAVGLLLAVVPAALTAAIIALWSVCSLWLELRLIASVWEKVPGLREERRDEAKARAREEESERIRQQGRVVLQQQQRDDDDDDDEAAEGGETRFIHSHDIAQLYNTGSSVSSTPSAASISSPAPHHSAFPSPASASPLQAYLAAAWLYYHHPLFLPSIAYCLLYVSILSFGGIMTAYLSSSLIDLPAWLLAVGRGAAALVGIIATLSIPSLIASRLSLVHTGTLCLLLQCLCLCMAVLAFLLPASSSLFLPLLFTGLISSRFGLWGYDLCETQLMQPRREGGGGRCHQRDAGERNECLLPAQLCADHRLVRPVSLPHPGLDSALAASCWPSAFTAGGQWEQAASTGRWRQSPPPLHPQEPQQQHNRYMFIAMD